MHSQNYYLYLFTKISIFETTGYRKPELNTWCPHSNGEISILPVFTAVPFGDWFSIFRSVIVLLITA